MSSINTPDNGHPLSLEAVRAKLNAVGGRAYWRSLEELSESQGFEEMLHREFPSHASEWVSSLDRRSFLKMMAASIALAGLSSCARQPDEKIVPYVKAPEELVPGRPLFFATAMVEEGYAIGTLVRSDMGRPTKVEGNPRHPGSLGATDVFGQASILTLYDPDRSRVTTYRGEIRPWDSFVESIIPALGLQQMLKGSGLRILTETVTSPTLTSQLKSLLERYPNARWHQYQAITRDAEKDGGTLAFGEEVRTIHRFDQAEVVVSFDSDFLMSGPASVRYQHDFALKRRVMGDKRAMNRLYVLESTPSNTGAMADHRLPIRSVDICSYVRYAAAQLGVEGVSSAEVPEAHRMWLDAMVRDLRRAKGESIVVAGETQPALVHAMVHGINAALGNVGRTMEYIEPVESMAGLQSESLSQLVADLHNGQVQLLLVLGGNPVFDAPADLQFAEAMEKADVRVRLGMYEDETSSLCHWHLPESHSLEAWSDARAFDGTATILQPLIAPLYSSKSAHEVLNVFLGDADRSGYEVIRNYWQKQILHEDFQTFWTNCLNDGIIPESKAKSRSVVYSGERLAKIQDDPARRQGIEIVLRPDPMLRDGRWANNGWLQELPKPITKLTWDNAVLMSIATAEKLGVTNEDVVAVRVGSSQVEGPVFIVPGHADNSVTLHFGYGRKRTGRVGTETGFDAYPLRTLRAMGCTGGAEVSRTSKKYALAVTQQHHAMEERHPVRVASLEEYEKNPGVIADEAPEKPAQGSLYPGKEYSGYAWGMVIDLNACTGCNVCTIACQSENNIPVVGKEGVERNREMHWIRVDQYFDGTAENPAIHPQPLGCVQCENAPCEVVCPVGATTHDHEGLNVMVYNRCVGTRYCSNNCPYKVRRFNFLEYNGSDDPVVKMMKNPDVTVRSRGVMEKCTYCVQRISHARIDAEKKDRPIHDGEVVTACQAACPSQAIMFGDLNDESSRVRQWRGEQRDYALLAELNTRPRTTYLARLKNLNPEIPEKLA